MIQRIQSLYLLVASLFSGAIIFFFKLWETIESKEFYVIDSFSSGDTVLVSMSSLFFISSIVSFCAIFLFKNRQLQFVLGRLVILINFILLGIIVYYSQNLSGEIEVSEKGIGLMIPVIVIILVVLANKAIKKDEELVKSVDRLR